MLEIIQLGAREKQKNSGLFKKVIYKMCVQIIYI